MSLVFLVFIGVFIVIFIIVNVNAGLAFGVCVLYFFHYIKTELSLFFNWCFFDEILSGAQRSTSTSVIDWLVGFCVQDVLNLREDPWTLLRLLLGIWSSWQPVG